jgi:hypothetical protein
MSLSRWMPILASKRRGTTGTEYKSPNTLITATRAKASAPSRSAKHHCRRGGRHSGADEKFAMLAEKMRPVRVVVLTGLFIQELVEYVHGINIAQRHSGHVPVGL